MTIQERETTESSTATVTSRKGAKYQRTTNDSRKDIIKYWEDHHGSRMTMKAMAENLNISRTTLTTIVKVYTKTGRVELGSNLKKTPPKVNEEMLEYIKTLVNNNPDITASKIRTYVLEKYPMENPVTLSSIRYALKHRIEGISPRKIKPTEGKKKETEESRNNEVQVEIDEFESGEGQMTNDLEQTRIDKKSEETELNRKRKDTNPNQNQATIKERKTDAM